MSQTSAQTPQKNDTKTDEKKSSGNFIGDIFDLGMSTLEKARQAESPVDFVDVAANGIDSAAKSALKTADAMFTVSLEDEKEFGKMFNKEIIKYSNVREIDKNNVDKKDKRLYSIWKKLSPKRIDITYHLFVIEKETVNAFAHAGGYVYIYTGLIEKCDDAILAFVLAHEISHIDLKHVCAGLGRLKAMETIPGNELMNAIANKLSPSYSQEDEFEADAAGWQLGLDAGYRPNDMIKIFDILSDTSKSPEKIDSDDVAVKIANQTERIMYRLEHHFDTHPQSSERKKRLNNK
jgi:predicted Zn-dependent protease